MTKTWSAKYELNTKFCQISTWKIWFQPIERIFQGKIPQIPKIFCNKFQYVAKNVEDFLFYFLLSYLVCSPIWLNYFLDDHHFDYITKSCYLHNNHLQPPTTYILYLPTYIASLYRLCDRKVGGFYKIGYQNGTLITQLWLAMYLLIMRRLLICSKPTYLATWCSLLALSSPLETNPPYPNLVFKNIWQLWSTWPSHARPVDKSTEGLLYYSIQTSDFQMRIQILQLWPWLTFNTVTTYLSVNKSAETLSSHLVICDKKANRSNPHSEGLLHLLQLLECFMPLFVTLPDKHLHVIQKKACNLWLT